MIPKIEAENNPELSVKIVRATPLIYRDGKNEEQDRPKHVRAASSLAHFAEYLAVVQDDANFLALVEKDYHHTQSIALPEGPEGNRVFGHERDNIAHKLDLEACVSVPGSKEEQLVAFGSGSDESREWVLLIDWDDQGEHKINLINADRLYSYLRTKKDFCGSGLNIEGAVFTDNNKLKLFQRGNSEPQDNLQPVDATAILEWQDLHRHLLNPEQVDPPELTNIVQYELGTLHGVRLTFSDAEQFNDQTLFSASAEASSDSDYIAGSVLGKVTEHSAYWSVIKDMDGSPFEGKIEGLTIDPENPKIIYFVIDDDDATQPSKIFQAHLNGSWYKKK